MANREHTGTYRQDRASRVSPNYRADERQIAYESDYDVPSRQSYDSYRGYRSEDDYMKEPHHRFDRDTDLYERGFIPPYESYSRSEHRNIMRNKEYGSDKSYRDGRAEEQFQDYSGRGPKGWRRSDERIEEEVCECLERDRNIDASEIEVKVKDGIVTLCGTVDERRIKRMAEDIIESVSGVRDIRNELSIEGTRSPKTQGTIGSSKNRKSNEASTSTSH